METEKRSAGMCASPMSCGGMCGTHHWGHIIVRVAVAILIFWCGVQFGEVKSMLRNHFEGGYQPNMMNSYGNVRYGGMPMMYNYTVPATPVAAPSATTATTPAKK